MSQHFQVKLWHNGSDLVTRTVVGEDAALIYAQHLMARHFTSEFAGHNFEWSQLGDERRFGTREGHSWPKAVYVTPVTVPVSLAKSAPTSYVKG